MKLAFVNSTYQLGGAETVAQDLFTGCAAAGHSTRFYVAAGKDYPRHPGLVPMYPRILSRLHHSRLRSMAERWAPRYAWTDRRLRNLADGWPDLVHVHNFHGNYASLESLAYLARRKPVVWTLHGHWGITGGCDHPRECTRYQNRCGECPRLGLWPLGPVDDTSRQLEAKVEHLSGLDLHVIAPSRFLAERIARSRVGRRWQVHHIPNGVSPDEFSSARKRDPAFRQSLGFDTATRLVLVANRDFRDSQKGFDVVQQALAAIAPGIGPLQVVLAGEGSDWAAAQLPPAMPRVSLGYIASRPRMAELFEAADIFLFASPAENFPCVILEAMASGCCVVATPTSGVVEQVEDGLTAILADSMAGADLSRALTAALRDPLLARDIGYRAQHHARAAFSRHAMIQAHLALYDAVLSTASTPAA